ncbi:hypothetical protein [Streptomyces sp. NBC_01233]|uniref:hypothetical protein n=1 Tax=Streptomyces sp. NBC_01233 TaxID=2903787 RepID=UPI002E12275A|nr:hypothetical protein OG332_06760 [Streptomyces sp. NBC_01233]
MASHQTSGLIGAAFGVFFVQANAAALPPAVAVPLRLLAIAAFIRLFIALRRSRVPSAATGGTAPRRFGRGYLIVVAAEVAAVAAGLFVINRLLHAPQATVGWIALVVGLHFFGLAAVWRMPSLRLPAAAMSACGAVGLVLAACGCSTAVIAAVAGIAPGALLLGSVRWSVRTAPGPAGSPA